MPERLPPPPPPSGPSQVILAFDFGLRRIGVACGNTVTATATALETLPADGGVPDWKRLLHVVQVQGAAQLVVGRPYNVDGSPHGLTGASDRFAAELTKRCRLPVARVDERYSSLEAEAELRAARRAGATRRKSSQAALDSHAAAAILRRWLAGEGRA